MDDAKPVPLYEEDFLAWTAAQAEALRAHGRSGNAIDFDHVAEEIEDLGRSELRACESLLIQILRHLAKLGAGGRTEPFAGWRREVTAFRLALLRRLTPTIRAQLQVDIGSLWEDSRRLAAADFAADEPGFAPAFAEGPPFTIDQILDPDWWPAEQG